MNKSEFTSYCRQHISLEESGLSCPSVEDIERWTKHGYFRYAPQYHKDDIHLVFAILRNEKEFREAQAGKEVPESGKRLEHEKEPFRDKEPVTEYETRRNCKETKQKGRRQRLAKGRVQRQSPGWIKNR